MAHKFNVEISERLWGKFLKNNPQFAQVGADAKAAGEPERAAIFEAMLAGVLTASDMIKTARSPLEDSSMALMLAVGHVKVEERTGP